MSQALNEAQNAAVGAAGALVEVSLMQSTNYWKNAAQQNLPFSLNPRVLYRGYSANCINIAAVTGFQFMANGRVKQMIAGGDGTRPLSSGETLAAGFVAGVMSAGLCGPLELCMIQQQLRGGSLASTGAALARDGLIFRGMVNTAAREGVYTACYLGVAPLVREMVRERFAHTAFGATDDRARLVGAVAGGLTAAGLSHPADTVKTVMQGDERGRRFRTARAAYAGLWAEGGARAFYRGVGWRSVRQIAAVFILDKARVQLSPLMFPAAFAQK